MHHSMQEWKKELHKALHQPYYHPSCDFCHNELIVSHDEMEVILFEPVEEEQEYWIMGDPEHKKHVEKTMVSSDPKKDIFKFKCPVCGHICEVTREELMKLMCSYYGDNNIRFELDDVETERAHEFMKNHDHSEELRKKKSSPFFSTLGQQFSFEFIPGGLGDGVVITCNHCKESKDITNTDNW